MSTNYIDPNLGIKFDQAKDPTTVSIQSTFSAPVEVHVQPVHVQAEGVRISTRENKGKIVKLQVDPSKKSYEWYWIYSYILLFDFFFYLFIYSKKRKKKKKKGPGGCSIPEKTNLLSLLKNIFSTDHLWDDLYLSTYLLLHIHI